MKKTLIKLSALIFLLFILSYCGTCAYIDSNKKELIKKFEKEFSENCNGEIRFSDITLSSWTKFPCVSLKIKDLEFTRFNVEKHKEEVIKTKEASVKLSVSKLIRKKIQVKSIFIKDAVVELITNIDSTGIISINKVIESEKKKKPLPLESNINLVVENLQLSIINHQKNKKFKFKVKEINANLDIEEDFISGSVALNTQVSDLAFNTKTGGFFNGATVVGTLKPTIDLKNNKIDIPTFDLLIDDQVFKVSSEMNLIGAGDFLFKLENEETHHSKTLEILPPRIQEKLKEYAVEKPLYTHTTIKGSFGPKSNPVVDILFKSEKNIATIKNNVSLDEVHFSGRFINRIYDDHRANTESPKNSRLLIDNFKGIYKGVGFQLKDVSMLSTPEVKTGVKAIFTSKGSPEQLNKLLGSDTFFFEDGTFDIKATLNGDATYIDSLIGKSKISVTVQNSNLVKRKGNLHIPIKNMSFDLHDDIASLNNLEIELPSKEKIDISGEIKNFANIISKETNIKASSDLKIHAKKLVWDNFLTFLQSTKDTNKKVKLAKHSIQETLKDVYVKFNPTVQIDIEELVYKSFKMNRFKAGLHYKDINNLYLDTTSFDFNSGNMLLSGHLNIINPEVIYIDAKVKVKGGVENLNTIFNSNNFIFKNGKFDLKAHVNGDLKHMDKLLANANSALLIKNTAVYLVSNKLNIPIEVLDVNILNNNLLLNKLQLKLAAGDKIDFSGKLENIDALLINDSKNHLKSYLTIHSKKLAWNDFTNLFHKDKKASKSTSKKVLKETLGNLYNSFNPSIKVHVEDFKYSDDVSIQNFKTGIHFDDIENLKLENTSFIYDKNATINLSAKVNISDPTSTLINASFAAKGNPDQLNSILKNDNFIFKGGSFSFDANIKGDIHKIDNLIANATSILKLDNTDVLFKGAKIPIKKLEVDILKNDAILKTLKIGFPSGDEIELSGEVDNLTSLIFNKENSIPVKSELHVKSKRLAFNDFTKLFATMHKDKTKKKAPTNLSTSIHHIYNQFNPTFTVAIDAFEYNDIVVDNFKTNIHFESANKIFLEDTGFDFYKGSINLNAHLDIEKPKETLFALKFDTNRLNLEKLLKSFDYFGMDVLKNADKIDGEITLKAFLEGNIGEGIGLQSETLSGQIAFDLEDIEVKNFTALTSITDKIFKKERFEDIRFSPIKDVIYIANNTVEIPQFEIQSTAIDFFIEGHLGLKNNGTNIWVSVPLNNLKHKDVVDIPDKKGYIDAGKKVFVEIASEGQEKAAYKLHLTNKKLYEQKHILGQYKKKHREEAHLRRKHRRAYRSN